MFDKNATKTPYTPPTDAPIDPDPDAYLAGLGSETAGLRREPDADVFGGFGSLGFPGEPKRLTRSVDDLDAVECLELLRHAEREQARRAAFMIRVMARLAVLRDGSGGQTPDPTVAGDEVAAELDQSPISATRRVAEAVTLVRRLPAVVDALENGEIDLTRARALVDLTTALSDNQSAAAVTLALSKGRRSSPSAFRRSARRIVYTLDPEGAERRRKPAPPAFDVRIHTRGDHSTARLSSTLPAADAARAYERIDHLARRGLASGDPRSLPQRRVDVLLDLVLGRRPVPYDPPTPRTPQESSTRTHSQLGRQAKPSVDPLGRRPRSRAARESDAIPDLRPAGKVWHRRARATVRRPHAEAG
ncbi:MAG: DUF222 domain-containing protein [Frankia sp.]